jgi:hypothetical protein
MLNEELVLEWQIADATLKTAQERFDTITADLAKAMIDAEIKSDLVCVRGQDTKVTVVQGETLSIDETALCTAIGKRAFNKVCTQKVSRELLEKAVVDGRISEQTVAGVITIKPRKAYVKVTPVEVGHE